MSRYDAAGGEADFEPGSKGEVLANLVGINDPGEMNEAEMELLEQLYTLIFSENFPDRRLTVDDLKNWHRRWLGNIYQWAGEERSVNMAKGGFHFAAAAQIPYLLAEYEQKILASYTPCREADQKTLALIIAEVHVEFILIHPFREGNGRLGRLLADVIAVQAGRTLLDFSGWDAKKEAYIEAIQRGLDRDYQPMAALVEGSLSDYTGD